MLIENETKLDMESTARGNCRESELSFRMCEGEKIKLTNGWQLNLAFWLTRWCGRIFFFFFFNNSKWLMIKIGTYGRLMLVFVTMFILINISLQWGKLSQWNWPIGISAKFKQ